MSVTLYPKEAIGCHTHWFRPGVSAGVMSGISGLGCDGSRGGGVACERQAVNRGQVVSSSGAGGLWGKRSRVQAPEDSGCGVPNPLAISCSRIFLRPRCSRDITVPTGVPMISAISRYG